VDRDEQPAREAGDRLRFALLAVSLAGLAGAFIARHEASTWLAASILFGVGVLCCLVSLFTLKERELARRTARDRGDPPPRYEKWDLRSSWTWDSLAFAMIAAGGVVMALGVATAAADGDERRGGTSTAIEAVASGRPGPGARGVGLPSHRVRRRRRCGVAGQPTSSHRTIRERISTTSSACARPAR
jgi:hypothetical protein